MAKSRQPTAEEQAELDARELAERRAADRNRMSTSPLRGGPTAFQRTLSRGRTQDRVFMEKVFPAGTVFEMKRSRYANGRFWVKGTQTTPLKKAGHAPSPAWTVHHIPDEGADPQAADTMSDIQQGKGVGRPEGA